MTVWRPPATIRVKVLGLLLSGHHLFAAEVRAADGRLTGVRPLGGTVEFGEMREATLHREFREELGTEVEILGPFQTFENLFHHDGAPGHEILFIAPIRLLGRTIGLDEVVDFQEADGTPCRARWFSIEALARGEPALYPGGLLECVTRGGW